MQLSDNLKDSA